MCGDIMEKSIARMITFLARRSQGYIGAALSKYNLSAAEQPFFMALRCCQGITQEELTALVGVDKAVTTRVVRSLEAKGFLTRVQDEHDRRQNRIYPTEKVEQLGLDVSRELLRFNSLLTQGIDPKSLEIICAGLQKMEDNMAEILSGKSAVMEQGEDEYGANESSN